MACKFKNVLDIAAESALVAFESFAPVLEAAGRLNPALGNQIQAYVTSSVTTLTAVVQEIESGDATLTKIAGSVQSVIAGFNGFSGVVPPGVSVTVNLVNAALQTLLFAIQQQIAMAHPEPVMAATAHALMAANPDVEEKVHAGLFERGHLNGMKERMGKVQTSVAQLTAAEQHPA